MRARFPRCGRCSTRSTKAGCPKRSSAPAMLIVQGRRRQAPARADGAHARAARARPAYSRHIDRRPVPPPAARGDARRRVRAGAAKRSLRGWCAPPADRQKLNARVRFARGGCRGSMRGSASCWPNSRKMIPKAGNAIAPRAAKAPPRRAQGEAQGEARADRSATRVVASTMVQACRDSATRIEKDALGEVRVPARSPVGRADAALDRQFSDRRRRASAGAGPVIRAFGVLKKAAAIANGELGELAAGQGRSSSCAPRRK